MNWILTTLDELEAVGAEIASKLAPWLAPLLSAVVIAEAVMVEPFSWPIWQAVLTGAALELLGIATLSTALMLWSHYQAAPADHKPSLIPLGLAALCALAYFGTALVLAVVIKTWPQLGPVVYGLFVVLALVSAVNLSVRRDHYRRIAPAQRVSRKRTANRPVHKPPRDQSTNDRRANLNRANDARQPTQSDYNRAAQLKAAGYTWSEVGDQIGRSGSTAKRWAGLAEPVNEPQPVHTNGKGGH